MRVLELGVGEHPSSGDPLGVRTHAGSDVGPHVRRTMKSGIVSRVSVAEPVRRSSRGSEACSA